jgi:hypothetical protein
MSRLADGSMRPVGESETPEAEVRHAIEVEPSARVWPVAAARDRYETGVDAVDGSEFLDDRLRLTE